MKNTRLYNMHIANNAKVYGRSGTVATEKAIEYTARFQEIGQQFAEFITAGDSKAEKKFLSDPVLFNKVKVTTKIKVDEKEVDKVDTHINVFFGDTVFKDTVGEGESKAEVTKDLKKLRTARIEQNKAGVFSDGEFVPEDRHLQKFITPNCVQIQDLNWANITAQDAMRIFEGLAIILDAQQFVKTQIHEQIALFLKKYPLENISKLKKMYQLNHPDNAVDNFYLTLAHSVKLLKQYAATSNKNEDLPTYTLEKDIETIERFLPNSQTPAQTITTADYTAAFNVISAANKLRNTLKLEATSTDEEVENAVKNHKKSDSDLKA